MIDYAAWTIDELRKGAEMCEAIIYKVLSRSPRSRTIYERKQLLLSEREHAKISAEIQRRNARRTIWLQRDAMWA